MTVAGAPTRLSDLRTRLDAGALGLELHDRIRRLFPICRSITGAGVRETLRLLSEEVEIHTEELPTGTRVFDWTIPKEWNIRDAFIKDGTGRRVVDFNESNLHVVNYSVPVHGVMSLADLRPHLHSIPEHPEWIPYKTSYYAESWGFCLPHRQLASLTEDQYEVCIDSTLRDGHLTLGQLVLPGDQADEVLFSCHVCHPSLGNDNLSGVSVAVTLARLLATVSHRYTYRFLFIPGTIGAIAWLARNEDAAARVRHGLVLACAGDRGSSTYKRSRQGNAAIDRATLHVLQHSGDRFDVEDFTPYGYDERQVLLAGIQSAGRGPVAHAVRAVSRVPHVRGQPRFRRSRRAGRYGDQMPRHHRRDRRRCGVLQFESQRRAAAGQAWVVCECRRPRKRPGYGVGPAVGTQSLGWPP